MNKYRGEEANRPKNIPKAGWKDVLLRVKDKIEKENVPIIAAGVAFYFFLAIFPAIVAVVSSYGLITDPEQLQDHMEYVANVLPEQAHEVLSGRLENLIETAGSTLGWGVVFSIIIGLWSANKGTFSLFRGVNVIYKEDNSRGLIKQNAITLAFTLGFIIVGVISMSVVIAFPALIGYIGLPDALIQVFSFGRWLILACIIIFCIALIYQFAPQRRPPRLRWVSVGSITATVLWILGSLAFTLYVQNFGNFDEMYGSVAAVIILMLWLNLTAFLILLGAVINSELEHQTNRDTTRGEDKPLGERQAHYADQVANERFDDKRRHRQ